jgi:hypothetical protein
MIASLFSSMFVVILATSCFALCASDNSNCSSVTSTTVAASQLPIDDANLVPQQFDAEFDDVWTNSINDNEAYFNDAQFKAEQDDENYLDLAQDNEFDDDATDFDSAENDEAEINSMALSKFPWFNRSKSKQTPQDKAAEKLAKMQRDRLKEQQKQIDKIQRHTTRAQQYLLHDVPNLRPIEDLLYTLTSGFSKVIQSVNSNSISTASANQSESTRMELLLTIDEKKKRLQKQCLIDNYDLDSIAPMHVIAYSEHVVAMHQHDKSPMRCVVLLQQWRGMKLMTTKVDDVEHDSSFEGQHR